MIGQDNDLFRTRVCESFFEATIFVILQCFVSIKEKTYTKLELFSILLSCYCTGIPLVEFIDRRLRKEKITNMTVIEHVILVVLWAADVFIRILPILYMLVSDSVGAWCVIATVWVAGMIFLTYVSPWEEMSWISFNWSCQPSR